MKNISVLFASNISKYVLEPVISGKTSLECTAEFAGSLPDVDKKYIFCNSGLKVPEGFTAVEKEKWTVPDLISAFKSICPKDGNIFFMFADSPLLNSEITDRMYKNHCRFLSQYTYADGYPAGLAPEIISQEILEALLVLSKDFKDGIDKKTVFAVIEKDINSFDLETEIAPEDLRLYRVSLTSDNRRNFNILKSFVEHNATAETDIIKTVTGNEELLRSTPAYFSVQIISRCPQKCSFCPWPEINPGLMNDETVMKAEDFRVVLEKISAIAEDAVISISLWGEPSLHPDIAGIVSMVLSYAEFRLVIETSGIGWKNADIDKIGSMDSSRIIWIISLETGDPAVYRKLRGEGLDEAAGFAAKMIADFPDSVYVQAVRMKESEEALEGFYRFWKQKTEKMIIQKYDHFSHFLPERKVTDLSPLSRMTCWHLKRDMSILINGDVPVCREDLKPENVLGNIFRSDISGIWSKGEDFYKKHIEGKLPQICRDCDEYYTYNF